MKNIGFTFLLFLFSLPSAVLLAEEECPKSFLGMLRQLNGTAPSIEIKEKSIDSGWTNYLPIEIIYEDGGQESFTLRSRCGSNYDILNENNKRVAIGSADSVEDCNGNLIATIERSLKTIPLGDKRIESEYRIATHQGIVVAYTDSKESGSSKLIYRDLTGKKIAVIERHCDEPTKEDVCNKYRWTVHVAKLDPGDVGTDASVLVALAANAAYPSRAIGHDDCYRWKPWIIMGSMATVACCVLTTGVGMIGLIYYCCFCR